MGALPLPGVLLVLLPVRDALPPQMREAPMTLSVLAVSLAILLAAGVGVWVLLYYLGP